MKKFHALDQDGLARVGEKLSDGDVYINKYRPDMTSVQVNPVTKQVEDLEKLSYKPEE